MTDGDAIEAIGARWTHPPRDPRDVEERIAIRRRDMKPDNFVTHRTPAPQQACRIFLQLAETGGTRRRHDGPEGRPLWSSLYVHSTAEVDGVVDALEQLAGEHRTARAA